MSKAQLRAVENEVDHPRDAARKAVKRWRSNAEKEKLPVANQSTGHPNLFVDEVLQRTLREMPDIEYQKPFPWIAALAFVGGLIGVIWIFTS